MGKAVWLDPDLNHMDREALQARLVLLRQQLEKLDAKEPEQMDTQEYETWAAAHEDLEDRVDDVLDALEALEG